MLPVSCHSKSEHGSSMSVATWTRNILQGQKGALPSTLSAWWGGPQGICQMLVPPLKCWWICSSKVPVCWQLSEQNHSVCSELLQGKYLCLDTVLTAALERGLPIWCTLQRVNSWGWLSCQSVATEMLRSGKILRAAGLHKATSLYISAWNCWKQSNCTGGPLQHSANTWSRDSD